VSGKFCILQSNVKSVLLYGSETWKEMKTTTSKLQSFVNLLTPNVNYSGRTALLTSKVAFHIFIQQL